MGRIHYYRFPEGLDPNTRFKNGAISHGGECQQGRDSCRGCEHDEGEGWLDCKFFTSTEADDIIGGLSITLAKKLLREFGGSAWTDHCERDGGVFDTSEITLTGNNSKFKYNHHL